MEPIGRNAALRAGITDHVWTEEALQDAFQRLRDLESIVNKSPAVVFLRRASDAWPVEFVSENVVQFGYAPDEFLSGRVPYSSIVHPDDRERITSEVAQYTREGRTEFMQEYRIRSNAGKVRWLDDHVCVRRDASGNVTHYQGIVLDITERKRAEDALRRQAEELAALQATVLDMTMQHDLPTLLRNIVERAAGLLDAPSGGLYLCDPGRQEARCAVTYNTLHDYTGTVLKYGEGAAGIVAQTGQPLIIDDYRRWPGRAAVYEEEQPFTAVLSAPLVWQGQVMGVIHVLHNVETRRFTAADLDLLTLFANHAAIAIENARLYEAAQREIAERKRTETMLRQAKDYAEKLIETANVIVLGLDTSGRIQVFNEAAEKLTGYTRAELADTDYFEVFVPRDRYPHVWEAFGKLVTSGLPAFENPILTKSGEERLISWQNSEIREEGKIVGTISFGMDITERKRVEEAFFQNAERLALAVDGSNAGLWDLRFNPTDPASTPPDEIYLSPKLKGFIGYSDEEFPNSVSAWKNRILPEDRAWVEESAQSHLEGRRSIHTAEYRIRHKDGSIRWILTRGKILTDNDGRPLRWTGIDWDITERKRAEEALRESEARLSATFENLPFDFWARDQNGRIILQNSLCVKLWGDQTGKLAEEAGLNEQALAIWQDNNRRAFAGEVVRGEVEYTLGKERKYFDNIVAPIRVGEEIHGILGFNIDITERKRAEVALREKDARLQDLFDEAPVGYHEIDSQGRIMWVNRTELALLGYTAEEMLGRPVWEFILEQETSRQATLAKLAGGVVVPAYERTYLRKDGTRIPVLIEDRLLRDPGGQITGNRSTIQDITERKRAEEVLAERTGQLEAIRAVTAEIARELELTTVLSVVTRRAAELVGAVSGAIWFWDEEAQILVPKAWHGYGEWMVSRRRRLGEGMVGKVAQSRQGLIINDYRNWPEAHPTILERTTLTAAIGEPLLYHDRLLGAIVITNEGAGRSFTKKDGQLLALFASQAAIAIENARLYEAAQRELAERAHTETTLRIRTQQLEAVRAIDEEIVRELDLRAVLDLITRRAAELVGVSSGMLRLWDEEAGLLVPKSWVGLGESRGTLSLRLGEGVAGTVAQRRQGLVIDDFRHSPYTTPPLLEFTSHTAVLSEPLLFRDRLVGTINLNREEPGRPFTEEDRQLLALFATHAAIAIENARLFDQVRVGRERLQTLSRRLVEVQEAERRNIARELHDEIGQVLTGLKLIIEMGLRARPEVLPARLEEARALVSDLMERVRELSLKLRPAMLDDLGLLPALLWQFERYTAQTQIRVNFKHVGLAGRRFTPEVETAVYRILQEALTNVARHANTGEATVYLRADQHTLTVEVEDRGAGFDPAVVRVKQTTSGLAGMRERARLLSGHLKVEATPGAGTVVRAELPLRPGRSS